MYDVVKNYGRKVFNDFVMKERLPEEVYKSLKKTIENRTILDASVADVVANAMKEWALEQGVTHFTHWFSPMTGITAEKHDAFISLQPDGRVIMEFSGKELFQGEPDASSFPSGGIRATFEARGYTAWDPTSYAFIKNDTLCIPTAFASYTGETLDKKTPLLRSMQAISKQGKRILKLFGDDAGTDIITNVGAEQEYFLIERDLYQMRPDLVHAGRTLFGIRPTKGQDLDDHYFGALKPTVAQYMQALDEALWDLGISAKTKHNEVAPGQHELACIYETANLATDHNQIVMETMKQIAPKYGLVCLLHEKPFAGVNGSGKHNNWSIGTANGENLLNPGETPRENARFLLFLAAVIKAVDENQDLLRIAVATAGNDHRLGANEAPPAIISIFLGDELTAIIDSITSGKKYHSKEKEDITIGVDALPSFPKDNTDRNRTSPFAFTGNKFEFRMVGSSLSIAGPNFILNTIVADSLAQFADELEQASDFTSSLDALIKREFEAHERIVFNGDGYSDEWLKEAAARGLLNLRTTPEALELFSLPKNKNVFSKHMVLSETEIESRQELLLENYSKVYRIEALTMLGMAKKEITPAVLKYSTRVAKAINAKRQAISGIDVSLETDILTKLSDYTRGLNEAIAKLDEQILIANEMAGTLEMAKYYSQVVAETMQSLRIVADDAERLTDNDLWPFPSYADLLYSVK